jgi:hypothetical protein
LLEFLTPNSEKESEEEVICVNVLFANFIFFVEPARNLNDHFEFQTHIGIWQSKRE